MSLRLPTARPRLLPMTSAVMGLVLLLKCAGMVEAAIAAPEKPAEAPSGSPPAPPSTSGEAMSRGAAQAASTGREAPAAGSMQAQKTSPAPAASSMPAPAMGQAAAPNASPLAAMAGGDDAHAPSMPSEPATVTDEERALLLDLRHRREALDARARQLDERGSELEAAGLRLRARVQQLTELQTRLEALEADRKLHEMSNWTGLVKTYEAMKPRDAAAIFDALDMQVLLQVLDRMQDRKTAAILAAMQPDRARLATQMLAEMRTRATTVSSPGGAAPKS